MSVADAFCWVYEKKIETGVPGSRCIYVYMYIIYTSEKQKILDFSNMWKKFFTKLGVLVEHGNIYFGVYLEHV